MKKVFLRFINWYQVKISPYKGSKCRYHPSCSEYAKICFTRFNIFKAGFLTVGRLLRCNPLFKPKYDPPPEKRSKAKNSDNTYTEIITEQSEIK